MNWAVSQNLKETELWFRRSFGLYFFQFSVFWNSSSSPFHYYNFDYIQTLFDLCTFEAWLLNWKITDVYSIKNAWICINIFTLDTTKYLYYL